MDKIETEEQLIELWKSFGINNLNDYFNNNEIKYDYNVNHLLSPHNIKADIFWGASRKHFNNDCIAGYKQHNNIIKNLDERDAANKQNFDVAKIFGVFWLVQNALQMNSHLKKEEIKLLEIGTGMGCLPELGFKEIPKEIKYYGYDVYPDYPNVEKIDNYIFSEEQVEYLKDEDIDLVYSCNVFQHIDKTHQYNYILQLARILRKGKIATIMFAVNGETSMYGQKIYLPSEAELLKWIEPYFSIVQTFRNNISEKSIDTRSLMLERK